MAQPSATPAALAMRDDLFWECMGNVWSEAAELRAKLLHGGAVDLGEFADVVFRLGHTLVSVSPSERIYLLREWRSKAHVLWATGRVPTTELAYFVVALGKEGWDAAVLGRWETQADPSEGAFAALLVSFDDEAPPTSPLARDSRPATDAIDTPTPRAVRVPPRGEG